MRPRLSHLLIAASLLVPAVLLSDGPGLPRQCALASATALLLWLVAREAKIDPRQILCAIAVATVGELTLSLAWGLYCYRWFILPLYVPVGHGLFYALAATTSRQGVVQRRGAIITRTVLVAGTGLAFFSLARFDDAWGFLWWLAAALLIARSRNSLLLSVCFTYTLLLEWLGTAIGNWRWAPVVPGLGLHAANPPSGVGILYVLLDLITVTITTRLLPAGAYAQPDAVSGHFAVLTASECRMLNAEMESVHDRRSLLHSKFCLLHSAFACSRLLAPLTIAQWQPFQMMRSTQPDSKGVQSWI